MDGDELNDSRISDFDLSELVDMDSPDLQSTIDSVLSENDPPPDKAKEDETLKQHVPSKEDETSEQHVPSKDDETLEKHVPSLFAKDKKRRDHFCMECNRLVPNFGRHMVRNHKDMAEIIRYKTFKPGSKERRNIIAELRQAGDFVFASDEYEPGIIPSRRNMNDQSPKKRHYVYCTYCLATVKRKNGYRHSTVCLKNKANISHCQYCSRQMRKGLLRLHYKFCDKKKESTSQCCDDKTEESPPQRERRLRKEFIFALPVVDGASKDLKDKVLGTMKKDKTTEMVRRDSLILTIGSMLRENHREASLINWVSGRMRVLAQLVAVMHRRDPEITDFKTGLRLEHNATLLKSVQEMCGYDEATGYVQKVGMPHRLSPSIHIAYEVIKMRIKSNRDLSSQKRMEQIFEWNSAEEVFTSLWKYKISTNAEKSRKEQLRHKDMTLPTRFDVKKAERYLEEEQKRMLRLLEKKRTKKYYKGLSDATQADMTVFNSRRGGEVRWCLLSDYINRPELIKGENYKELLSSRELKAGEKLTMFYIKGKGTRKGARNVVVYLTPLMKRSLDRLIVLRSHFEIESPYLFPQTNKSPLPSDGGAYIRKIRTQIGLSNAGKFNSRNLRKECASNSKIVNPDENHRRYLADHMGHDDIIHRNDYEVPLATLQRAKVGAHLLERRGLASDEEETFVAPNENSNTPSSDLTDALNADDIINEEIEHDHDADPQSSEQQWDDEDEILPKRRKRIVCPFSDEKENEGAPMTKKTKKKVIPEESDNALEDRIIETRKKVVRTAWSLEEQKLVLERFGHLVSQQANPAQSECEALINTNSEVLGNRTWQQVKIMIVNIRAGRKKVPQSLAHLV